MKNIYLDTNEQFNDFTFNKREFFNTVEEILRSHKIPIDDLKANISCNVYEGINEFDEDAFQVKCLFSWTFYFEDVTKKDFNKLALQIEEIFREQFNLQYEDDVKCTRYYDSEYTENGYDVDLKLRITYKLNKE